MTTESCWSLRGHGASRRSTDEGIANEVVTDVVDLLHALAIKQCVLVGQSLGGLVALATAIQLPNVVTRLVLIEAGVRPITPEALSSVQKWLADFPSSFESLGSAEFFFGGTPLRKRTWAQGMSHDNDGYHPRFDRIYASHLIQAFGAIDRTRDWKSVKADALLIVATSGGLPEAEVSAMKEARPNTTLVHLDGGHDIHLDQPAAVAAEIAHFLQT